METICESIVNWIEEEVEKEIIEFEEALERRCRKQKCNWWLLCLNKLFCWLAVIIVKVVRLVVVTVTKVVIQLVCNVVTIVLDAVAYVVGNIFSIPVVGGIIRLLWNVVLDVVWRLIGVIDFILSLFGFRPQKKIRFKLIIPNVNEKPIASAADYQIQIDNAIEIMEKECSIKLIYNGVCNSKMKPPSTPFEHDCGNGIATDLFTDIGTYFEMASAVCQYRNGWRKFVGLGGEIAVFAVNNITGDGIGCSFGPLTNYITMEASPGNPTSLAHEIGHTCGLTTHSDDPTNLMFSKSGAATRQLTALQVSIIRTSRFCSYV